MSRVRPLHIDGILTQLGSIAGRIAGLRER